MTNKNYITPSFKNNKKLSRVNVIIKNNKKVIKILILLLK